MATKEFKVTVDGKVSEFVVKSPTFPQQREAQKIFNQAFTDAVKSGSVVRDRMNDLLTEQGLWSDKKEEEFKSLQKQILDNERQLARGGIKLSDARELALKTHDLRAELRELISARTSLDVHSAEGQADNARFNYYVSACVYNKDGSNYFSSLDDYMERNTDPVAVQGAQTLANMMYGLDANYEKNLAENKFLRKYKFVDEELRLVNKEGKLIDRENRLIDDFGRFVDASGNLVDKFGNRVDENGDYVVDTQPFLDDDGKPVEEEKPETVKTVDETEKLIDTVVEEQKS